MHNWIGNVVYHWTLDIQVESLKLVDITFSNIEWSLASCLPQMRTNTCMVKCAPF